LRQLAMRTVISAQQQFTCGNIHPALRSAGRVRPWLLNSKMVEARQSPRERESW
jgi:hypothetical protein